MIPYSLQEIQYNTVDVVSVSVPEPDVARLRLGGDDLPGAEGPVGRVDVQHLQVVPHLVRHDQPLGLGLLLPEDGHVPGPGSLHPGTVGYQVQQDDGQGGKVL